MKPIIVKRKKTYTYKYCSRYNIDICDYSAGPDEDKEYMSLIWL